MVVVSTRTSRVRLKARQASPSTRPVSTHAPVLGTALGTETAITLFGILGGVGNAIAQLIGSRQLGSLTAEEITLAQLGPGVAVATVGAVVGALLLPSGG